MFVADGLPVFDKTVFVVVCLCSGGSDCWLLPMLVLPLQHWLMNVEKVTTWKQALEQVHRDKNAPFAW